jgi:hypothetical protein
MEKARGRAVPWIFEPSCLLAATMKRCSVKKNAGRWSCTQLRQVVEVSGHQAVEACEALENIESA